MSLFNYFSIKLHLQPIKIRYRSSLNHSDVWSDLLAIVFGLFKFTEKFANFTFLVNNHWKSLSLLLDLSSPSNGKDLRQKTSNQQFAALLLKSNPVIGWIRSKKLMFQKNSFLFNLPISSTVIVPTLSTHSTQVQQQWSKITYNYEQLSVHRSLVECQENKTQVHVKTTLQQSKVSHQMRATAGDFVDAAQV